MTRESEENLGFSLEHRMLESFRVNSQDWTNLGPVDLYELTKKAFTLINTHLGKSQIKAFRCLGESSGRPSQEALLLLKNAELAMALDKSLCQDTGVGTVYGFGSSFSHDSQDKILEACRFVYKEKSLRNSVNVASSMTKEDCLDGNYPCLVDLSFTPAFGDNTAYVFAAKGGGSQNKTQFYQKTASFLNKDAIEAFIDQRLGELGSSACPPYGISLVIGGLSPEQNLMVAKLASLGLYSCGEKDYEDYIGQSARKNKVSVIRSRVLRLPRHGASCPVSFAVTCNCDRTVKAVKIGDDYWLENLCDDVKAPSQGFLGKEIDLDEPIGCQVKDVEESQPVLLSGSVIVARDKAHIRFLEENDLSFLKDKAIFYAGPCTAKDGSITSFGPTTASRMDEKGLLLIKQNLGLVTIAKGQRTRAYEEAVRSNGGYYFEVPGGIACLIASEYLKESKVIMYEELGMEAVRLCKFSRLPAYLSIKSN